MFDKLMGGLSRRAERRASENAAGALRDAQGHLRLLARAGRALIAAREEGADAAEAVEQAVGWAPFLRAVAEAERLAQPEAVDVRAELVQRWPATRQFAPALLEAFAFEGAAGTAGLLKAVALLREMNRDGKRALPKDVPTGFIRRGWRPFVMSADGRPERRAWEVCVLSELRDRLRAGDVWVRGSRRYRNFEDCLLPRPTFAALRAEGPLPVGVAGGRRPAPRRAAGERSRRRWPRLPPWPRPASCPTPRSTRSGLRITPLEGRGAARGAAARAGRLRPDAASPDHRRAAGGGRLDRVLRVLHPPAQRPARRRPGGAAHRGAGRRHQPGPDPDGGGLPRSHACASSPGRTTGTCARSATPPPSRG